MPGRMPECVPRKPRLALAAPRVQKGQKGQREPSPKKESAAWADDEDGPVLRVARRPPSLRGGDRETRALVVVAPRHKSRLWTMVPAVNVDDAAASLRRGRGVRVEAGGAARWSPRGLRDLEL